MNQDNSDDLDLTVSEAFNALDSYEPIDVAAASLPSLSADTPIDASAASDIPDVHLIRPEDDHASSFQRGRVLAIAAAVILAVVVGGFVIGRDDPTVVASGTSPDGTAAADTATEVEDSPEDDTESDIEDVPTDDSIPTTTIAPETDDDNDPSAQTTRPATTEEPVTEEPTTEPPATDPPTTTEAPTTDAPADTAPPLPGEQMVRGQVTEILLDCVSHTVLGADGQPQDGGPVLCDGGSYMIVGGVKVVTTSGFTADGAGFDRHPRNVMVGDVVEFLTVLSPESGLLTLECDNCGPT